MFSGSSSKYGYDCFKNTCAISYAFSCHLDLFAHKYSIGFVESNLTNFQLFIFHSSLQQSSLALS